ncbi:hypothetical protein [Chlorogloeopsis sp. ULAP02]|uniref:hypothetical protein n=1 Tax=Chlorogloeopsis sp. ULAP02 TaxID=3107926 RepID=UPI003136B967
MSNFTESQIIETAKNHILATYRNYAYPVVPTDEYDHPMPYEPECVPWVVCKSIEVKDGQIGSRSNEEWEVGIKVDWKWVHEDSEDEPEKDVFLSVSVFAKDGQLFCGEIDRVWLKEVCTGTNN